MNNNFAARILLGACLALLVGALAFQGLYALRESPQAGIRVRLADVVPRTLSGWTISDESLGQSEARSEAALKVLNLDDYVYRRFRKRNESFTIYAAYWAPGRMPTRLVASHTPDRCWTENGMRCVDMRFRQSYEIGGSSLLPAEVRAFTPGNGGAKIHVAYWHTVEGKLYDYGARFNAVPSPWLWWKDTLAQAAYGSREQLFVRITSDAPLDPLWTNEGFKTVMKSVADLGLWRAAP